MSVRHVAALAAVVSFAAAAPAGAAPLRFRVAKLRGTARRVTEPRVTVAADGRRYVVSNLSAVSKTSGKESFGDAVVFRSVNGGRTWPRTPGKPPQTSATIDVDVVAMHAVKPGAQ